MNECAYIFDVSLPARVSHGRDIAHKSWPGQWTLFPLLGRVTGNHRELLSGASSPAVTLFTILRIACPSSGWGKPVVRTVISLDRRIKNLADILWAAIFEFKTNACGSSFYDDDFTTKGARIRCASDLDIDKQVLQPLTVFSYIGSQWVGVAYLGLAEIGTSQEDVEIREIDLCK